VLSAHGHDILHRKEQSWSAIDIDVGDDLVERDCRGMSEVVRTQKPHFFPGDKNEEHGAARRLLETGVGSRDLEESGNAGGIVKRAMADVVAVDGRADAEVVHVRGVDDVLIAKGGIGAYNLTDDVGAFIGGLSADGL